MMYLYVDELVEHESGKRFLTIGNGSSAIRVELADEAKVDHDAIFAFLKEVTTGDIEWLRSQ